ncbi:uncharacterized protein BT62DRAFT_765953 [Guyanagaster necrorhizus]|uniref:F-box domain-containing protein n=1 Tax=Guyanagaster necrorhizus TaxID=856835 RepID=A0A9P8AUK6_9AGAR|nr:uncharacterized protein BT62DRAFT_765953 [Guyanagaster necrorhizus MCA 3950]KAG7448340.1 hypothetical protein BT62DRAFT_765953 [Guyanagaster necrorhizus MCA 3950]
MPEGNLVVLGKAQLEHGFKSPCRCATQETCPPTGRSAISTIPNEILSEIFVAYSRSRLRDVWEVNEGPRLLEKICALWRDVVISSPRVWSSFAVVARHDSGHPLMVSALKTYLSRSATCPLSFTFTTGFSSSSHLLLDVLVSHSDRWTNVTFDMPLSLYRIFTPIHNRLSLLHSLSLKDTTTFQKDMRPDLNPFQFAPRLQKLTLCRRWNLVQDSFPWHQLTYFSDEGGCTTLPNVLFSMSRLEELVYRPTAKDILITPEVHVLPQLRKIRILSGYHLNAFLDSVSMPSVQEITLDDMCLRYETKCVTQVLQNLLVRSRACLKTLSIDHLAYGDASYLLCLFRCTPRLTSLSIRYWSSQELSKLCRALSEDSSVLPDLQTISLQSDLTTTVYDVVDMIRRRWRPTSGNDKRLQSVKLSGYPIYDMPSLLSLRGFCEEGLDVRFCM